MKRILKVVIYAVIVCALIYGAYELGMANRSDAVRFANEYTEVSNNNVFVYRTADEIVKILENGTGAVFLGFPECPWCQRYAKYLNEVAKDVNLDVIYYCNIYEDRLNNTEAYQKIVALLGDSLDYDAEGNHRIFVPDLTIVYKGEIKCHDNETSMISSDENTPDAYWTDEQVTALKTKLKSMLAECTNGTCSSCNK